MRKYAFLLLFPLSACIGPQWDYHQAVDCRNGETELGILQKEYARTADQVIGKKLTASSLITPDEKAAALLGGNYPSAKELVVLDYIQAAELRSNDISATCQIVR